MFPLNAGNDRILSCYGVLRTSLLFSSPRLRSTGRYMHFVLKPAVSNYVWGRIRRVYAEDSMHAEGGAVSCQLIEHDEEGLNAWYAAWSRLLLGSGVRHEDRKGFFTTRYDTPSFRKADELHSVHTFIFRGWGCNIPIPPVIDHSDDAVSLPGEKKKGSCRLERMYFANVCVLCMVWQHGTAPSCPSIFMDHDHWPPVSSGPDYYRSIPCMERSGPSLQPMGLGVTRMSLGGV